MASMKDLRKRMGSVKNTQQTTRAMKMVSAAKLRRAQEAILHQRAYTQALLEMLEKASLALGEELLSSPYLLPPACAEDRDRAQAQRVLCVLFTSDRGLCGGFNQVVVKTCQKWLTEKQQAPGVASVELCFVGKKGWEAFRGGYPLLGPLYPEFSGKVSALKAQGLSQLLLKRYLQKEIDQVFVVYHQFQNAMTQVPVVEQFLPWCPSVAAETVLTKGGEDAFLFEPSTKAFFELLLEQFFEIHLFRIFLDAQAGEHGARMSAMENATKNAGEMIRKLTLEYNKQRQAGITKELLEIIAGSESQKQVP